MELVALFWNGTWSPMSRRNIWLRKDGDRYQVEWSGDSGRIAGQCWRVDPRAAVDVVGELIEQDGGEHWREVTSTSTPRSQAASR